MFRSSFRRSLGAAVTAAAGASTLFALGCGGAAQTAPPITPEPIASFESQTGPLLWRVEGPNGPSYLFGTMHMGVSLADVGPSVAKALDQTKTFISETDLTLVNQLEVLRMGTLGPKESLEALLGSEAFDELARLLSRSLNRSNLDRLKPWFAYLNALQAIHESGASIDAELTDRAKAAGKEMIYLETWQFQLGMLSELITVDDVKEILKDDSPDRKLIEDLGKAYRAGDFDALTTMLAGPEAVAKDPRAFKLMFADRNRAWVKPLADAMRAGPTFVAVGAGHFAGDEGVLALLKAEGIEAVRVSP